MVILAQYLLYIFQYTVKAMMPRYYLKRKGSKGCFIHRTNSKNIDNN
jgi:hypothetical protein